MPEAEVILRFPTGLIGYPDLLEFRLIEPEGGYPLKFLQSVQQPEISFTCMDAIAAKFDYQVPLDEPDAQLLELTSQEEAMVLVLVVPHEDLRETTANLAGPLVINTRTLVGVQVVLDILKYPLQFPIFAPLEDLCVQFPEGLLGFEHIKSFRLFEPQEGYPLKFLQSVEEPDIAFTCIDVASIQPEYEVALSDDEAATLALEEPNDAMVVALVVIPKDPRQMTANLAGPLVINCKTRIGRQIVLNTEKFPLKFPILSER